MPNHVLGWNSGGSMAENIAKASIGFLDLEVRDVDDVVLNSEPDAGGLTYLWGVLEQGVSMHGVAEFIVASDEFQAAISGPSTAQIVEMFQVNGLDRSPESAGHAFWTAEQGSGQGSMADVLMGFAQGTEQDARLASYRAGSDILI